MNEELQLGTIQYQWGKMDYTYKVTGELFENFLDQGAESLVFEKDEFVYKINKDIYYSLEELEKAVKDKLYLISLIKEFEPIEYVGYVKVVGFDAYHIVYKQKKLRPSLEVEWQQLILNLHNDGWNPHQFNADKKGLSLYGIRKPNTGVNEFGEVKIIDCKIYSRELELQKMARN